MARDFKTKQDGISDFYGQQSIDAGASLQSIAGGYTNSVTGLANQGLVLKIASATALGNPITFVAFMESLNDNFSQNFNQDQVFGRMDPIQSYQNTERKLSMSWKLLAANVEEAQRNMYNISRLTKLMYPEYTASDTQNKISSAPIMAIKYMNLVRDTKARGHYLFGTISSLSITPDLEFGVLTAGDNGLSEAILPKIFTLSISFTPIHHGIMGSNQMRNNWLFGASNNNRLNTGESGTPVHRGIPPESIQALRIDAALAAILAAQDAEIADEKTKKPSSAISDSFKAFFRGVGDSFTFNNDGDE